MLDPAVARILLGGDLDFNPDELYCRYEQERRLRVRSEGSAQYTGAAGAFAHFGEDPWITDPIDREPITGHSSTIIIGGGFGGLVTAARLRGAGFDDVRIIESAGDFGGTWYWNRYPGAMCDIEAHIYMPMLEEMGYSPKHRYAYADELFAYSQSIGRRYGLYDRACFQTTVQSAVWSTASARWTLTTDRGDHLSCNYLVIAAGRQSLPKLPRINGIGDFGGHIFHSCRWDYEHTGGNAEGAGLTGLVERRVGVIGTGATALQIVPPLATYAEELLVFQRTPSAVGPRGNCPTPPDWVQDQQPGWQRRRRVNFQRHITGSMPDVDEVGDGWTDFNKQIQLKRNMLESSVGRTVTDEEFDAARRLLDYRLMNHVRDRIDQFVPDPETASALKPWYRWMCKRPGWHDDYIPAFARPNVRLVDTHGRGVDGFTPSGVLVGDIEYKVDTVIFATGFEAAISYTELLGFDPVGASGRSLSQHWTPQVRTWFGLMTDDFPNCFFVGNNQQTGAAVNATHTIEEQALQLSHVIGALQSHGGSVVVPTVDAVDDYISVLGEHVNRDLIQFHAECTPGYFNNEGRATKNEELFSGGRFADPLIYFGMLEEYRAHGKLTGLEVS
ncbi:monooxygenase [Nocardioides sp. Root1257]|uniref:flavin-containing monooxygenase n=1 Tax=unclassified Nocardioides TaxID=2615069 RepID=UPI000700565D|nr:MULTISPECIES: NAD(P)/FAD-dependent oxidoreductase [unclassified Nocardioides]KQW42668.1 monooxygenase [Nocardioides sp. Root1257]KRC39926.1 monooxygenase [Nocardioides sp. Root224]